MVRTHTLLRTHTANTYTQQQYYEVQVVLLGYTKYFEVLHCNIYSGEGRIRCFLGKIRSSPSGTSPAENRHPQACLTRVLVRTKLPTVEDRHRQEHARRGKIAPHQQSLHYRYSYPYEFLRTDTTTELHFVCGTEDVRRREMQLRSSSQCGQCGCIGGGSCGSGRQVVHQ